MTSIGCSSNEIVSAWTGPTGSVKGVFARIFDSSGNPLGGEILVDSDPKSEWATSVAVNSTGNFFVAWKNDADDVRARVYSASGSPLTNTFAVRSTSDSHHRGR